MRRLAPVCFALLGVALVVPAGARAGVPENCLTCNGQPVRNQEVAKCKHKVRKALCAKCRAAARAEHAAAGHAASGHAPHLCAKCMAKAYPDMVVRSPNGSSAPVMTASNCTACQSGGTSGPVYVTQGDGAGYATVNGGPGYTVLSSTVMSTEPVPVGVMRASYNNREASAPGYATVGPVAKPGSGADASAAQHPVASSGPDFVSPPRHQRPHILRHLFGLDAFGHRREMMEAQSKADHAAISYGQQGRAVTDLPASLVYGPAK